MANTDDTFGFEILHKLHHNEIQKKEDVLILFVHWYLAKCRLRCIGIGDNNVFDASQKGSELLPKDWNTGPSYALRYVKSGTLYLLCGIKSDNEILINFARLDNDTISNVAFPIEETVSTLDGSLETMIPSYETILHELQHFLRPVCKFILVDLGSTTEVGTQTDCDNFVFLKNLIQGNEPGRNQMLQRPFDFESKNSVGVADLYSGGHGGGMIFDPFNRRRHSPPESSGIPGRLPLGAVPPGARFDPFGPRDLSHSRLGLRRPDSDHLPPPGFDDMFM